MSTRSAFVLALLVGVQSAWVNPTAGAAELRALICCAHECDRPVSVPAARECCSLTVASSGPAEGPLSQSGGRPPVAAIPALAAPVAPLLPRAPARDDTAIAGLGPPVFLTQHRLLI